MPPFSEKSTTGQLILNYVEGMFHSIGKCSQFLNEKNHVPNQYRQYNCDFLFTYT